MVAILGAYDPTIKVSLICETPSVTQQCHKAECDIHNILRKYDKTGLITHINNNSASYDDFTSAADYHAAMNVIAEASSAFASLPSELRLQFNNDPGSFMEFIHNDENYDEAVKLGLVRARADLDDAVSVTSIIKTSDTGGVTNE